MKKGIFRYGWRIGLVYLWWRFNPAGVVQKMALYGEDPQWSAQLEALLCFEQFRKDADLDILHMARLGDTTLWIGNHPYASFAEYGRMMDGISRKDPIFPSRFVVYLAERKCREQGIKLNG